MTAWTPAQWRAAILEEARRLEFDLAGVAAVEAFPDLHHFADWITRGRAGAMHYLSRRSAASPPAGPEAASSDAASFPFVRQDVRHAFPWARSVICCGLLYNSPYPHSTECGSPAHGWISRYAWGDDYHAVVLDSMRQLAAALQRLAGGAAAARVYVDTGPLVERAYAAQAGLGWIGKNTCLLHEAAGSFYFLGALITDLAIAGDTPLPDRCGSCTRCLEACPTGALDQPYQMDASRCIAYLNIELRGPIPEVFRSHLGQQVVGCDICQDVCPWNWEAPVTARPAFQPRPGLFHPELEELAALSEEQFRERFRGSAVKRVKYRGLLRNVALAMGNSRLASFRPTLLRLAAGPDAVVAEAAQWALAQLDD